MVNHGNAPALLGRGRPPSVGTGLTGAIARVRERSEPGFRREARTHIGVIDPFELCDQLLKADQIAQQGPGPVNGQPRHLRDVLHVHGVATVGRLRLREGAEDALVVGVVVVAADGVVGRRGFRRLGGGCRGLRPGALLLAPVALGETLLVRQRILMP